MEQKPSSANLDTFMSPSFATSLTKKTLALLISLWIILCLWSVFRP